MKKTNKTAHEPQFIPTKLGLAKRLEIARGTLDRYLWLPGAPKRGPKGYNMVEVADWISSQSASEQTQAKTSDEIRALKA